MEINGAKYLPKQDIKLGFSRRRLLLQWESLDKPGIWLQRCIGEAHTYQDNAQSQKHTVVLLYVLNPILDELGITRYIPEFLKKKGIRALIWRDTSAKECKGILVEDITEERYPLSVGRETVQHNIPVEHFKAMRNQNYKWMTKKLYRRKRGNRGPKVVSP